MLKINRVGDAVNWFCTPYVLHFFASDRLFLRQFFFGALNGNFVRFGLRKSCSLSITCSLLKNFIFRLFPVRLFSLTCMNVHSNESHRRVVFPYPCIWIGTRKLCDFRNLREQGRTLVNSNIVFIGLIRVIVHISRTVPRCQKIACTIKMISVAFFNSFVWD